MLPSSQLTAAPAVSAGNTAEKSQLSYVLLTLLSVKDRVRQDNMSNERVFLRVGRIKLRIKLINGETPLKHLKTSYNKRQEVFFFCNMQLSVLTRASMNMAPCLQTRFDILAINVVLVFPFTQIGVPETP